MWEKGRGVPIERETFSINDFVAGEGVWAPRGCDWRWVEECDGWADYWRI